MPIYINGLLLGLSLIMALGPQNIFLIRQASLRQHAILSAMVCFFSDLILISASVVGLKDLLESKTYLRTSMIWFGVAFLLYYGSCALKSALSSALPPSEKEQNRTTRRQIIFLALGFSLLNPHAVIDSLVLIGGGSGQFPGQEHIFLLGVLSSSLVWFSALTFSAYYFSNVISRASVWRLVEFFSGVLMVVMSAKLALSQY